MRYASMTERRDALRKLGPPTYATMAERMAALREVDKFKLKLRGQWPPVTGWITHVRSAA
jgi:hypothetical protein